MKSLALLVLAVSVFCDPIRDVMMSGGTHEYGWIARHVVKWLAFYPPLVYITICDLKFRWRGIILIALSAEALWLCGLWVAGWPWTPWWLLKLKGWP